MHNKYYLYYRSRSQSNGSEVPIPKVYEDPFEIHEKLKRNMMLYVNTDPNEINSSNLDKRLDNQLKTITPASMNDQNYPQ